MHKAWLTGLRLQAAFQISQQHPLSTLGPAALYLTCTALYGARPCSSSLTSFKSQGQGLHLASACPARPAPALHSQAHSRHPLACLLLRSLCLPGQAACTSPELV